MKANDHVFRIASSRIVKIANGEAMSGDRSLRARGEQEKPGCHTGHALSYDWSAIGRKTG
jgi:hypothetical protein